MLQLCRMSVINFKVTNNNFLFKNTFNENENLKKDIEDKLEILDSDTIQYLFGRHLRAMRFYFITFFKLFKTIGIENYAFFQRDILRKTKVLKFHEMEIRYRKVWLDFGASWINAQRFNNEINDEVKQIKLTMLSDYIEYLVWYTFGDYK